MIQQLMTPKSNLITLSESSNCLDTVNLLEKHHLRCAPVVDDSQTIFRGNIYRYHIYQYHFHHPDEDLSQIPVTRFLKNTTKIVRSHHSLLELCFAIRDLPYVAVLNREQAFLGVIYHQRLLEFFDEAWNMKDVGYILKVETSTQKGELAKVARLVNRHCNIISVMTIDQTKDNPSPFILFQLNQATSILTLQKLLNDLRRRHYNVEYREL